MLGKKKIRILIFLIIGKIYNKIIIYFFIILFNIEKHNINNIDYYTIQNHQIFKTKVKL